MSRVLVIDDERVIRELLRDILTDIGHEVQDAPDGDVGIEMYRRNPSDLVITNIIMPRMDGIEVIQELRREFGDVKIIVTSGNTQLLPIALHSGAQRAVSKPFILDEVVDAVRDVLEGAGPPGELRAFGAEENYYAIQTTHEGDQPLFLTREEELIKKALSSQHVNLRDHVKKTVKRWDNPLRQMIRAETRLNLTWQGHSEPIRVRVVDGLPPQLIEIVQQFPDPLFWQLCVARALLHTTSEGLQFLLQRFNLVRQWLPDQEPHAAEVDVEVTKRLVDALLSQIDKAKILNTFRRIQTDVLGAYFFHASKVEIYWMAIGLVAGLLGLAVEDLAIVVLAHELTHAYTHRGYDIDGCQWHTEQFARAELSIVEGLAQFFTEAIGNRLKARQPGVSAAHEGLMSIQPIPYRVQRGWVWRNEAGGEIVRAAMLDVRAKGITDYFTFFSRLNEAKERIGTRKKQYDLEDT